MTKEELKDIAKEYLPDFQGCDVMAVEEINGTLADRRRQLIDFVEWLVKKDVIEFR